MWSISQTSYVVALGICLTSFLAGLLNIFAASNSRWLNIPGIASEAASSISCLTIRCPIRPVPDASDRAHKWNPTHGLAGVGFQHQVSF